MTKVGVLGCAVAEAGGLSVAPFASRLDDVDDQQVAVRHL
jgi:hypothetical protein